jgi:hypothetical protein
MSCRWHSDTRYDYISNEQIGKKILAAVSKIFTKNDIVDVGKTLSFIEFFSNIFTYSQIQKNVILALNYPPIRFYIP